MHTLTLSERQKYRVLPTLLEVEELHLAQCECPDRCEMMRRLREDIAELRAILGKPPPKQCRGQRRMSCPCFPKSSGNNGDSRLYDRKRTFTWCRARVVAANTRQFVWAGVRVGAG